MIGGVETPYLIGNAVVADWLEAAINKAIVDQFFCMFFLPMIVGRCNTKVDRGKAVPTHNVGSCFSKLVCK